MKPKYSQITRSLPIAVFIAASMPFVAQAGIFLDDTAGNATPTAADNGANTIRADGGTNITNPLVTIISGVSMTGDAAETEVLEITAANYTVNNAGSLSGTNHNGIFSTQAFTLSNTGTIAGGTSGGNRGILSTIATITNSGSITGTDDGIHFTANGGLITNYDTIQGITGGVSDGIRGRDNLVVNNMNGGLISGVQYGIYAGANVTVTNENGATISATNEDAVNFTGNGGSVTNHGAITAIGGASSDGIRGRDGLTVANNTNFNIFSVPVSGGSITGSQNGVYADDDLTLTNQNLATITGTSNGILAGDSADITNNAGGTITGEDAHGITAGNTATINNSGAISGGSNGINAGDNATITNHLGATITGGGDVISVGEDALILNSGAITSTGDDGINARPGSTITNNITGTINGDVDGIDFDNTGDPNTIHNYGSITGGTQPAIDADGGSQAIDGSGSVETVNLYLGSRVIGDVVGGGGPDILNFIGGLTTVSSASGSSSNSILGDVTEFDVINKSGTGVAFIGVPGDTGYLVQANTINITGGGLYINGDVSADTALVTILDAGGSALGGTGNGEVSAAILLPKTIINAGGSALGGTGYWNADINVTAGGVSAGAIPINLSSNPNNAIGTLSMDGNVTHSAGTFIRHDINPSTGSDDLIVHSGGTYALGANTDIRVSVTDNNTVLRNGMYTVIDSNAMITGARPDMAVQFNDNVTANDSGFVGTRTGNTGVGDTLAVINQFMDSDFTNSGTDLVFFVDHNYSQFGSTANEVAAGNMLDGLVNTATGDLSDLLAAMDYSDESYTEAVLAALDPGAYMATAAGLANGNYHLHRTVEAHNAAVRAGGSVASVAPAGDPSAKGGVPAPMPSGCAGRSNVWGSFSYDWQDLSTSNSSFDQDGESAAFTAGIDFTVAENFRLGLVAEGSQTDWDGNMNLGSEVDSYRFAAYANWGAATGWFVDALVGYNTHSVDQTRGTFMGTESASYDADGWQGMINAGYAMQTSAGTFSPYLGLEWQQLSVDSFDSSGGPLPVSVGGYDIDSFRALAGVRWEADLTTTIKGYASAAYAFEFEDDAADTTVGFGGGSYKASGMEQGDSVLLSAGIRWGVATCTTLDIGYRGEFAMDDGVDSNGANIGLNYSF